MSASGSTAAGLPAAGMLMAMLGAVSGTAIAGNGMNDIGFGAQSQGMAGADLALARDTSALNINPAGLTQIDSSALDLYIEPYYAGLTRHSDQLGNDTKPHNAYNMPIGGGYARHLPDSKLVLGIGFFVQGGAGFTYEDLRTPFGTRDDLSSTFGAVKLEPGLAWQLSDAVSVGAALGINYSMAREKVYPDTSTAAFSGFRADSLSGWSFNGKLGVQYRPDAQWVLAAAYTSRTPLKLEQGRATFNYDAAGFGRVTYRDAAQTGLAIAQEAGIGAAYRISDAWLVAGEVNWVDWSSAMKTTTLTVSNPDNNQLPQNLQTLTLVSPLNWRDQYVMAIGAEHRCNENTTLRFGLNYGRNPVPAQTTSPSFAVIGETALAAGFSHRLSGPWEISAGGWYQFPASLRYGSNASLTGPGSKDTWGAIITNFMISRRW